MPKHLKDLQAAGWPEARYMKAIEDFRAAGITIGYTPMKRSWFSQRIGGRKPGECIVAICWMGFGAFVDMLNAGPEAMLRAAEERIEQSAANKPAAKQVLSWRPAMKAKAGKAMNKPCICRQCGKLYDEPKSQAEYKGYCSMSCQHKRAKSLGYKKGDENGTEYNLLKAHDSIGSIEVGKTIAKGMLEKEKEQLKTLEAKMAAYLKDKGKALTDEEIRELCVLRSQQKEQKP